MTRLIGIVMAVALLVSVAPVLAGDSFQALSRLPAGLSPLDDVQLATIEGGYGFDLWDDWMKDHRDHKDFKHDRDHKDFKHDRDHKDFKDHMKDFKDHMKHFKDHKDFKDHMAKHDRDHKDFKDHEDHKDHKDHKDY
jgi:hypothetical protein